MELDTLCNWMSTTKVVAVIAIGQLLESGRLSVTDPVVRHLPEVGRHGKDAIRIEHLLTHTAGIPYSDVAMWSRMHETDAVLNEIYESRLEVPRPVDPAQRTPRLRPSPFRLTACPTLPRGAVAPPAPQLPRAPRPTPLPDSASRRPLSPGRRQADWEPGKKAGYHPYSAWFVLGEIIRRLDGRPFEQYAREAIFAPLGMHDCFVGMSHETYAPLAAAGRFAELRTLDRKGRLMKSATDGVKPREVMACVPGANGRGGAREWLRLFSMLLLEGELDGTRLLRPETVRQLTRRHRVGMLDIVQGVSCDWSLGLFVGSSICSAHASPNTFGHGGSQSSMGFCDPEQKLAAVIVTNTRPGTQPHYERITRICAAVYEDLGLVTTRLPRPAAINALPPHMRPSAL